MLISNLSKHPGQLPEIDRILTDLMVLYMYVYLHFDPFSIFSYFIPVVPA